MAANGKKKLNGKQGGNRGKQGKPPVEHQWKPGQSGNPAGRKPGVSVVRLLREALEANGEAKARELADAMIEHGIGGQAAYAKEVVERTDGKVADRLAGHDGGPLFKAYDGIEMDRV